MGSVTALTGSSIICPRPGASSQTPATPQRTSPASTPSYCAAPTGSTTGRCIPSWNLPEVIHLPARLDRHAQLRSAVELLSSDARQDRPGTDVALPALLDLLIVYTLRSWLEEQCPEEAGGWCAALKDPAVAAALDRIHRDPAHSWTVQGLASSVGLSRTTFAARFSSYVGQSPMAYLTWWRLSTASRLLRETNAPLAVVARQVGYGSEFAFAHAFKREFGTAPGAFRKHDGAPHEPHSATR